MRDIRGQEFTIDSTVVFVRESSGKRHWEEGVITKITPTRIAIRVHSQGRRVGKLICKKPEYVIVK